VSEATSAPPPGDRSDAAVTDRDASAASDASVAAAAQPQLAALEVRADLDVPGETRRQARVFLAWFLCLAAAVVASSIAGAHVPMSKEGTAWADEQLAQARARRVKIALALGLLLPALVNVAINRRYKRGGAHARGIIVDVTADGELRIWGRGHGTRVALASARATERLVDVYAGRLGAWRQLRLRVRGAPGSRYGAAEIELSTPATAADAEGSRQLEGGEGDCVELAREDFERIRAAVVARANRG
jgi:hypothetical protein